MESDGATKGNENLPKIFEWSHDQRIVFFFLMFGDNNAHVLNSSIDSTK